MSGLRIELFRIIESNLLVVELCSILDAKLYLVTLELSGRSYHNL